MYMANRAEELFPGASFGAAHCNFGLRGAESDGDEAFVREWCRERSIECFVKRFDTKAYAEENGVSIEMAARELRYAWFAELCSGHGFEAVSVAHNANDNAETLILNLLRGTGSRGLRGMTGGDVSGYCPAVPLRKVAPSENIATKIKRPLLGLTREEIEKWMKDNGCLWREDSTNAEYDCKRNIIRNGIFPLFKEINPSFIRTLNRDLRHLAQVDDIADDYFRASGLSMEKGVNIPDLLTLKHWEYVLFRLLEPYGLSGETFLKLVELLKSGRTISGKVFQSPTHIVSIKKKTLVAEKRG